MTFIVCFACAQDKEERRALGLVLLRGESVVSVAVESAPTATKKTTKRTAEEAGLPSEIPRTMAGRGSMTIPPVVGVPTVMPAPGLAGPAPGLGAPAIAMMQPQLSADPRLYGAPSGRGHAPFARGAPVMPPVGPMPAFPPGAAPGVMGIPPPQMVYGRGMVSLLVPIYRDRP